MLGYVTVGTNDMDKALAFFDALLGEIGGKRIAETERAQIYGFAQGPMLSITRPYDDAAATVGNGVMIALNAGSPGKVDAVYAKAMELGGTDEGAPGDRGGGFYGAYFRDLDGNKLCAFSMGG